jgi:hypothetical protein
MQILLAAAAVHRLHAGHPEVIGVGAQDMNGLAKAELDLEAVAIELQHLQRLEGKVRAEQEDGSACWVVNDDEAHDAGHGSPHEVQGAPSVRARQCRRRPGWVRS